MDGLSPVQFSAAQISAAGLSSIQSQHKRGHPAMDAAAKLLGITRATLRKRIEKFGIQRELNVK